MRLLDVLLRRTPPPEDERTVKAARLDHLEREVTVAVQTAHRALDERDRLADAVDDTAQALRHGRRQGGHA